MIWHPENWDRFQRALQANRLPSTFLFVGESGVGKRAFATRLAAALLCSRNGDQSVEPCGSCPECQQVEAGTHPDMEVVEKQADKKFIPIEIFVGDRDHRGREGLCHWLALKPAQGTRKVAIVDDADFLNVEGANSLLKTLEEPPPGSVLILIATSLATQLPTIRSRCQIVRFRPLSVTQVTDALVAEGICSDREAAERIAARSEGSVTKAIRQQDDAAQEIIEPLLAALGDDPLDSVAWAAKVTKHVNAAGEDATARRAALRPLLDAAATCFRQQMLAACEESPGDQTRGVLAANRLEVCLDAELRLQSNANVQALIECWLEDLAGLTTGRRPLEWQPYP